MNDNNITTLFDVSGRFVVVGDTIEIDLIIFSIHELIRTFWPFMTSFNVTMIVIGMH
jgi:hypothetical protein